MIMMMMIIIMINASWLRLVITAGLQRHSCLAPGVAFCTSMACATPAISIERFRMGKGNGLPPWEGWVWLEAVGCEGIRVNF